MAETSNSSVVCTHPIFLLLSFTLLPQTNISLYTWYFTLLYCQSFQAHRSETSRKGGPAKWYKATKIKRRRVECCYTRKHTTLISTTPCNHPKLSCDHNSVTVHRESRWEWDEGAGLVLASHHHIMIALPIISSSALSILTYLMLTLFNTCTHTLHAFITHRSSCLHLQSPPLSTCLPAEWTLLSPDFKLIVTFWYAWAYKYIWVAGTLHVLLIGDCDDVTDVSAVHE